MADETGKGNQVPAEAAPEAASSPEVAEAPEKASEVSELEAERRRNDELLSRLKYLQADFENYRKRVARDTEAIVKLANEALIGRIIPVLDDFDAALAHLDGEASKGIRMVHDNLLKALAAAGLEEIPAEGQVFDPYVHNCVQQVPDPDLADGAVKEVVRKGYRLPDRVLRPAQVIVVQNRGETNAQNHRN